MHSWAWTPLVVFHKTKTNFAAVCIVPSSFANKSVMHSNNCIILQISQKVWLLSLRIVAYFYPLISGTVYDNGQSDCHLSQDSWPSLKCLLHSSNAKLRYHNPLLTLNEIFLLQYVDFKTKFDANPFSLIILTIAEPKNISSKEVQTCTVLSALRQKPNTTKIQKRLPNNNIEMAF